MENINNMNYTIYETFVGAGGSHLGFKKNGFVSKYVNDINDECLKTLTFNNPEIAKTAFIDNTSILELDPKKILEKTEMEQGELDVLFGGIVCKGFSMAGERKPNDERNYFYHKQLNLVKEIKPKFSIIENVPGILNATVLSPNTPIDICNRVDEIWSEMEKHKGIKSSLRKCNQITEEFEEQGRNIRLKKENILKELKDSQYLISVMDDIKNSYNQLGYVVYTKVLNSAMFGAATRRERVIIVAIRKDIKQEFVFPEPTHIDEYLKNKYTQSYNLEKEYLQAKTVNEAMSVIDYSDKEDIDNVPMNHNEKTVERFKYIPEGESIAKYIEQLPAELKISKFYSRGNTMRLNGKTGSPTLVPGHSNFPVHPREHRSITVREAACITGFPLNYKFFGSHSKRCEHVGNAVPPNLSDAIAKSVIKILEKENK